MTQCLVDVLRSRNANLAGHADHLIREALRVLPYTVSTFPTGTSHGPDHTTTVETIGRMLLPDDLLSDLTDHELFYLALSCHYHDLAMAGTVADDATPEKREQVRRDHALRVGDIIKDKWAEFGFDSPSEAETLGEICRGHRPNKAPDGHASWDDLARIVIIGVGSSVRLRLISACIYAFDELHIGADRAPRRVQDWRDIRDEESKRHWKRHQAIQGPTSVGHGRFCYEIGVMTPGFEEDIRKNVLLKALNAVDDLRRQLSNEDIRANLPVIVVQWNFEKLWNVLLPSSLSDLRPRSEIEIEAVVWNLYLEKSASKTRLDSLCAEEGASEQELRAGIRRYIGDAIRQGVLTSEAEGSDRFVLATDERIANDLLKRMRKADNIDRLFVGHYHAHWEDRFFRSGYGRAFVSKFVVPAIASTYSVNLAIHPSASAVRRVLESTPSAMRVVMENRPLPTNLIRLHLLELATFTGATFDLFADPDLLLDKERRQAYRELAKHVASTIDGTVRFLEELALVGGLSLSQVASIQVPSNAAKKALAWEDAQEGAGLTVSISQTIPKATMATSLMPYVVLAAQRAGVTVQLTAAPKHSLDVNTSILEGGGPRTAPVSFLEIGQALQPKITFLSFQARLAVDGTANILRIYFKRFDPQRESQWPLRLQFGSSMTDSEGTHFFKLSISPRWPFVVADDLETISLARQISTRGEGQVQIVEDATGKLIATQAISDVAPLLDRLLPEWATEDTVKDLLRIGGMSPLPVDRLALDTILKSADEPSRVLSEQIGGRKNAVTSLVIVFTDPDNNVLDEEFLGFVHGRMTPNMQVAEGSTFSQWELDLKLMEGREEIRAVTYLEPDLFAIAEVVREWARNPSHDFPIGFEIGPPQAPMTRTVFTMTYYPIIDRLWHYEWPVRIALRSVSRLEAIEMEIAYWSGVGDERRAELLQERLAELREGPKSVSAEIGGGEKRGQGEGLIGVSSFSGGIK